MNEQHLGFEVSSKHFSPVLFIATIVVIAVEILLQQGDQEEYKELEVLSFVAYIL